jgi:hypothetical protein
MGTIALKLHCVLNKYKEAIQDFHLQSGSKLQPKPTILVRERRRLKQMICCLHFNSSVNFICCAPSQM